MNTKYDYKLLTFIVALSIRRGIMTKRNETQHYRFDLKPVLERNAAEVELSLFNFGSFVNHERISQTPEVVSSHINCNKKDEGSADNNEECLETLTSKKTYIESKLQIQPSTCVFALVACCAPVNYNFRYGCFLNLGCVIVFWELEPCQLETILPAARQTLEFYQQFESPLLSGTTPPSFSVTSSETWNTSVTSSATTTTAEGVTEPVTVTSVIPVSRSSDTLNTVENRTVNELHNL